MYTSLVNTTGEVPNQKYFCFFMQATKRHCRAHIHGDERSPLEKCVMYFVSVWIPVNIEGHSDF